MFFSLYRKSRRFFFLIALSSLSFHSYSQQIDPGLLKLSTSLDSLSQSSPQELIYIQTSKGIYEPSEDLWFKAYVLNAQTFAPSILSRTLYLQMFNEVTKKVVWQEKYEIQSGFTDGHIYLHDTLSLGDYLIATYTAGSFYDDNRELNSVRKVCIRKEIRPNYDGWIEPVRKQSKTKEIFQFGTYPEGGNLIAGTESRLAFKAVKTDGSPVNVKGTLYEDTTALLSFESIHAGMGSVMFTPTEGKKYKIRLSEPAIDSVFMLPEVQEDGISLSLVRRDKQYLEFVIRQGEAREKKTVYLRGQVRGIVCCIAKGTLQNVLRMKIPLSEYPFQGIAEFTLFDQNLTPIAERLVYVNSGKKLYIEANLDKDRYETKEKATLNIKVKDENGDPVQTYLGLSIYDNLYRDKTDPVNILTHCYLSSQVRGKIYDPAYYFDTLNTNREEALDLLLLTQGWRRYTWSEEELKKNGSKEIINDCTKAEIYTTAGKKKTESMQQIVKLTYPKNNKSELLIADSTGVFVVDLVQLKEGQGGYVYLKPMSSEEFKPYINVFDPFTIINTMQKNKEIYYPLPGPLRLKKEDIIKDYVEGLRTVKLKEVVVSARGTGVFRDKYMGKLDSMAKMVLNTDFICHSPHHVLNCFECKDDPRDLKPIEGKRYMVLLGKGGEILGAKYDGTEFYGSKMITYHYQKYTEEELLKKNNISRIKAYYIHREFYAPKYDLLTKADSVSDFRNTLLWQPLLITDTKGEAAVSFFCSDLNTNFTGAIEGISRDGLLGTGAVKFSVIKTKKESNK